MSAQTRPELRPDRLDARAPAPVTRECAYDEEYESDDQQPLQPFDEEAEASEQEGQ